MTVVDGRKFLVVSQAKFRPQHCVIYPQHGAEHPEGYFDTGNIIEGVDPHAYVSVVAVRHMAEELGWASPAKVEDLEDLLNRRDNKIVELEAELKAADKQLEAINTLRSERWRPVSKPGPKAKRKVDDE